MGVALEMQGRSAVVRAVVLERWRLCLELLQDRHTPMLLAREALPGVMAGQPQGQEDLQQS